MLENQNNFKGNERALKTLDKAIREKDINIWNSFLKAGGPHFRPNLDGIDLSDLNLKEANFSRTSLKEADFTGADLRFAIFNDAILDYSCFHSAKLQNSRFSGTRMVYTRIHKADLSRAVFENVDLSHATLTESALPGTRFLNTKLDKTELTGSKLDKTAMGKKIAVKVKSEQSGPGENDKKNAAWKEAADSEARMKLERLEKEAEEVRQKKILLKRKLRKIDPVWKEVRD